MKRLSGYWALALTILVVAGCTKAESLYFRAKANCVFRHVTAVSMLRSALTSPGQFCFVSRNSTVFTFQNFSAKVTYPMEALDKYYSYISFSGAGFIVGTTALTDLSTGSTQLVAFDRTCPACYDSLSQVKALQFTDETHVQCARGHSYDLNNFGLPQGNTHSRKLFRYPITWNGADIMAIQN